MHYFHKTVLAPAKVNFFLNVTGVRGDGYHLLHTLMHKIELSDEITFSLKRNDPQDIEPQSRVSLSLSGHPIPANGKNTAQKAVELFWSYIGQNSDCASIEIKKNIPDQAGLGGGSSDAATVLILLNEAYGNKVTEDELLKLAEGIGADVPFFLGSNASVCKGIGEQLNSVPNYSDVPLLIIKPHQGVCTAEAYAYIDRFGTQVNDKSEAHTDEKMVFMDQALSGTDRIKRTQHFWTNDFQPFALSNVPILVDIQKFMIQNGSFFSALSGSGSAWFACFDDEDKLISAYDLAREAFVHRGCFVCKTRTLSV